MFDEYFRKRRERQQKKEAEETASEQAVRATQQAEWKAHNEKLRQAQKHFFWRTHRFEFDVLIELELQRQAGHRCLGIVVKDSWDGYDVQNFIVFFERGKTDWKDGESLSTQ